MIYHFRAAILLLPESDEAVVMLVNAYGFEQLLQADQAARGVLALLQGKTPAPVSAPWHLPFLYWSIVLAPFAQIAVRHEGKAYGRTAACEWQEMDDFAGVFAPAQDRLAYLHGAKDMREVTPPGANCKPAIMRRLR